MSSLSNAPKFTNVAAIAKPTDARLRAIMNDESERPEVRRIASECIDARTALGFHVACDGRDLMNLSEIDDGSDVIDPHSKAGAR